MTTLGRATERMVLDRLPLSTDVWAAEPTRYQGGSLDTPTPNLQTPNFSNTVWSSTTLQYAKLGGTGFNTYISSQYTFPYLLGISNNNISSTLQVSDITLANTGTGQPFRNYFANKNSTLVRCYWIYQCSNFGVPRRCGCSFILEWSEKIGCL